MENQDSWCIHFDLPKSVAGCARCNGKDRNTVRGYCWREPKVIIQPRSVDGPINSGVKVWIPQKQSKCPTVAKVIHLSGNWTQRHFLTAALTAGVLAIELPPSQEFMLTEPMKRIAKNLGVGVQLKALRGPKS